MLSFFSLLLLTFTLISTSNLYARGKYVTVRPDKIDLCPSKITDSAYLNSPTIKSYLLECIARSGYIPPNALREMTEKINFISFFCFKAENLYDSIGRVVLHMWIPGNYDKPKGAGAFYSLPLQYAERGRSHSI